MKKIPLKGKRGEGLFALVDDDDYEELSMWSWSLANGGYAVSRGKLMHREIMKAPKGMIVDHGNHDRLDNRKANLRICTKEDNNKNRQPFSRGSRFKGVSKNGKRWAANITPPDSKKIYLGTYDTEIEAARAYNVAADHFYGKFAYLNPVGNWWHMTWEALNEELRPACFTTNI